jgi:hypothetical protein
MMLFILGVATGIVVQSIHIYSERKNGSDSR